MLIFECTNTVTMASSVKGFDKLIKGLDAASKKFQTDVKEIIEHNLGQIERQAIQEAPGPSDRVKTENGSVNEADLRAKDGWIPISQAIGYEVYANGFGGRVFVEKSAGDIVAWVEFGTGQSAKSYLVTVPKEWREIAARYIRNKRGTIVSAPYMLPAYNKYSLETIKELKQALKDITI